MTDVPTTLLRALKEAREEAARRKAKADQLRDLLIPHVEEAGGVLVDEVSGLTARLVRTPRYEYDATRLHRLVEEGLITEAEFAEALETVIDKRVVESWVSRGLITDRQLARADARVVTAVIEKLEVR